MEDRLRDPQPDLLMDLSKPWVPRALAICLALAVGAIVWLIASEGDEEAPAGGEDTGARTVSEAELAELAADSGHPVYWAGPVEGTELEANEASGGSVLVRYLEEGTEAGRPGADSLAVGSYAIPNPRKALNTFAAEPGATVRNSPELGRVVTTPRTPESAYFVDPGDSVQVEVYDPKPKRALRLVLSGQVQPIG